jgi:hypothetical protein
MEKDKNFENFIQSLTNIYGKHLSEINKYLVEDMIKQSETIVAQADKDFDEIDAQNLGIVLANAVIFNNSDGENAGIDNIKRLINSLCGIKKAFVINTNKQITRLMNMVKDLEPIQKDEKSDNLEELSKEELIKIIRENK